LEIFFIIHPSFFFEKSLNKLFFSPGIYSPGNRFPVMPFFAADKNAVQKNDVFCTA